MIHKCQYECNEPADKIFLVVMGINTASEYWFCSYGCLGNWLDNILKVDDD